MLALNCVRLIALVATLNFATCLKCYQCSGPPQAECGHLENIPSTECGSNNNMCGYYIRETPGQNIIHRECTVYNLCSNLNMEFELNPEVTIKDCRICETDGCNSATTKSVLFGLSLIAYILYLL